MGLRLGLRLGKAARTLGMTSRRARGPARSFVAMQKWGFARAPAQGTAEELVEELPRWDLGRHFPYATLFDGKLDEDMAGLEAKAAEFKQTYEGKLSESLGDALKAYEEIHVGVERCMSYAQLEADVQTNSDDANKRKAELTQRNSVMEANSLNWFAVELAQLPQEDVDRQLGESTELNERYKAFVDDVRKFRPYNLSKDVERALSVRSSFSGKQPVVEHYMREISYLRFPSPDGDGSEINLEMLLAKLGQSKDAAFRAKCLKTLNDGLAPLTRQCALSLNVVAGNWHIENVERGYPALRSRRNLENNVPDAVVDSLLESVRTQGVQQCKRYYKLKKEVLRRTEGLERLAWSDRNAQINIGQNKDSFSWREAVDVVEKGYRKFSPTMADMFRQFVDEARIDVPATGSKKNGAYCMPSYPLGPFELLNFSGTKRDVATLAHESGHACHFKLAFQAGPLQYMPPLTVAETASIFGEMVTFRDLLDNAPTKEDRLAMLLGKIDDIINSTVRQCSFDHFEASVHERRKNGELAADDLASLWRDAVETFYGPEGEVFDSYENIDNLYAYVPHFHAVEFYVYSYAFADLLVGSLYLRFREQPEGFEEKLLDLLRSGGTKDFVTALKPFGLDPSDPKFWDRALSDYLGEMLTEAEALAAELKLAPSI